MPATSLYFKSGLGVTEIEGGFYCHYCSSSYPMQDVFSHVTGYEHECATAAHFGRPIPARRLTPAEQEAAMDAMLPPPLPIEIKRPKIRRVKCR